MTEQVKGDLLAVPAGGTWETLACGTTEIVPGDITPEQEGGSDTSQLLGEAAVNQVLLGVWLRLADNVVRVVVGPDCLQITNMQGETLGIRREEGAAMAAVALGRDIPGQEGFWSGQCVSRNHLTLSVSKEGLLIVNNGYALNGTKRFVPRLLNHAGHGRYHPLVKR